MIIVFHLMVTHSMSLEVLSQESDRTISTSIPLLQTNGNNSLQTILTMKLQNLKTSLALDQAKQ